MHKPAAKGHTAKHSSAKKHTKTAKHVKHASPKHAPKKLTRHQQHLAHLAHLAHVNHTAAPAVKAHKAAKPRALSYNINCSLEALADTAPFYVSDEDIMALYELTPKSADGIFIQDALTSAATYGLAGHYLTFEETDYLVPGSIVGLTLDEGTHAAIYTGKGIDMWGNIQQITDLIEEAWIVRWL